MPRPATGRVVETMTSRGQTFALRFHAYGARRCRRATASAFGPSWKALKGSNGQ